MEKKLHIKVGELTYVFGERQAEEMLSLITQLLTDPGTHVMVISFTPTESSCGKSSLVS